MSIWEWRERMQAVGRGTNKMTIMWGVGRDLDRFIWQYKNGGGQMEM